MEKKYIFWNAATAVKVIVCMNLVDTDTIGTITKNTIGESIIATHVAIYQDTLVRTAAENVMLCVSCVHDIMRVLVFKMGNI